MKINLIAYVLLICIINASCKKTTKSVPTTVPDPVYIPWLPLHLHSGHALTLINYPSYPNVWGVLAYCKMSAYLTDTGGITTLYSKEWQQASFLNASGKWSGQSNAGDVTLNGHSISFDTVRHRYVNEDTVGFWKSGINSWAVAASAEVPRINADIENVMPVYTASLPDVVSMSKDLSLAIGPANTVNADSALFVLYYVHEMLVSNMVSAFGGIATIRAGQILSHFVTTGPYDQYLSFNGEFPVSNSSVFKGGMVLLVLFNHETRNSGGKQYVFVRETQLLRTVKFID